MGYVTINLNVETRNRLKELSNILKKPMKRIVDEMVLERYLKELTKEK